MARGAWKKSSYSGGGEGNACVEVALDHPHIAVRDSKAPARAVLTFPAPVFAAFLAPLRNAPRGLRTSA
ncbi:DUF397 domain-containing protein [Streptomyces sp. RM72]|uniref:DUF397 domain-containing protein n=1 Tax=unclassified Streptomyces TaxID=2593676 RepID=UPI000EF5FC66|nr:MULTISPECIES: DUF397 domain-containing protein [unclassified Streptomyces]MBQ0886190.1 DUF397 domain-containing protein [Streptomyces sp. RM72]